MKRTKGTWLLKYESVRECTWVTSWHQVSDHSSILSCHPLQAQYVTQHTPHNEGPSSVNLLKKNEKKPKECWFQIWCPESLYQRFLLERVPQHWQTSRTKSDQNSLVGGVLVLTVFRVPVIDKKGVLFLVPKTSLCSSCPCSFSGGKVTRTNSTLILNITKPYLNYYTNSHQQRHDVNHAQIPNISQ